MGVNYQDLTSKLINDVGEHSSIRDSKKEPPRDSKMLRPGKQAGVDWRTERESAVDPTRRFESRDPRNRLVQAGKLKEWEGDPT